MMERLQALQEADKTLAAARGEMNSASQGFFLQESLLYRCWEPPGHKGDVVAVEQLVLLGSCRQAVLHLAHEISLAGHMGKKTAKRILQRLY